MDLIITILPVVTKDLPISPRFTPYNFLSRCKFSTLTTRQPMVEFYLLTFPRFPLRKKEHKSYFGKNRTQDFRTSRCAGYLLGHSGEHTSFSFSLIDSSFFPSFCAFLSLCITFVLGAIHYFIPSLVALGRGIYISLMIRFLYYNCLGFDLVLWLQHNIIPNTV